MGSVLVFDIETYPNPALVGKLALPSGYESGSDDDARWMATNAPFCKIATIGCLASRDGTVGVHFFDGVSAAGADQEKAALEEFWALAKGFRDFVTFNGMTFDVPVLDFRSLVHGVAPTARISTYPFGDPGKDGHFDLMRVAYGGMTKGGNLGNLAAALGIEDSDEGSGADVQKWVAARDLARLHEYNYNDLRITGQAFERLFGRGTKLGFAALSTQLAKPARGP